MKINDFIFRFQVEACLSDAGICRVRLFVNQKAEVYAVLTELEENPSTSVTNAVELIWAQMLRAEKVPPQAAIIEHYSSRFFPLTFDLVTLDKYGQHPSWKSLPRKTVETWLECGPEEFSAKPDRRVQAEIQQALEGIPSIRTFHYTEPPEISERRLEIAAHQHSRAELQALLDTQPTERALAAFLKEDPSLLAERYAYPSDEYICFSEFPVGDTGRADFALFTGRSRMEVYLIECKDGRHTLRRANHYGAFRAAVQEGREQLVRRAAWAEAHYGEFRRFVHAVRQAVEAGQQPYGAFPGPRHRLQVDPEKDVELHLVFIGGRTSRDLEDSRARHREDGASRFQLSTETWDSWLGKLTRP
ncbi:protein of unknown function [Oscillibacter sp. PC13]|uniref:Shedu anti-phage system protein SduA domain-containing protein n=1 Tax=Oscillibacter sp. PC13 TaxID=1855299 RepID=UPI0008F285D6|nr:Shedu anti-phage system protein SduA domain-containing protein [Oscillibacter sp. PC13]SFP14356.1 protein of unknown function [Oscillibacter sp. PC13]